jgi:uncharacterized protein
MSNSGQNDIFLENLPKLSPSSPLRFNCNPEVHCFNSCCADLDLALSPYDVLRLRFALGIDSKTFIRKYGVLSVLNGNQFPSIMLKMTDNADQTCPFVRDGGCSVYAHRPGACRAYPIGRGASIDAHGAIHEEFILVREPHCRGFESNKKTTVAQYLKSQGMESYVTFDNHYIKLMHRWDRNGSPLPKSLFGEVFTAVYRPDVLRDMAIGNPPPSGDPPSLTPLETEEVLLTRAMMWLAQNRL